MRRPAMPMGISLTIKAGKRRSGGIRRGDSTIEDPETCADKKEESELHEDDDAGGEQCEARFAEVASGKHALHHELVGAVRGHGEEGSAEDASPEGVGLGEIDREAEEVELAGCRGCCVDVLPASGNVGSEGDDRDEGSGNVEDHLHNIGPDDGGHPSFEGVEQGKCGDDGDGEHVSRSDGNGHYDGDGEDADAFCGCSRNKEEACSGLMESAAEALVDELVGGEHFPLKIPGKEQRGDDDAAEHVADDDLKKAEVSGEGHAGNADDGESTGFGGDDREGDGPPGHAPVGEEVAFERL